MSSNPPEYPDHHPTGSNLVRKRFGVKGDLTRVKGKPKTADDQYRVRLLLFTARSRSETAVEVVHNILQTEDPFTNQLEELRSRLDTANFFKGPLMPFRTVDQIESHMFAYDFYVIHLIIAHHFQIPFDTQAYCQLIDNKNIFPVDYPFYVVKTQISYSHIDRCNEQIRPEQIHDHMFCIRSFLTNDGTRIWVMLDSIFFIHPVFPFQNLTVSSLLLLEKVCLCSCLVHTVSII